MPRKCIQVWFRLKESKGANSNFRLKIKCSPKINSTIVRTWHSFVNHVSAWTNNHTFMQILLNLYNFYYSICKFKPFEHCVDYQPFISFLHHVHACAADDTVQFLLWYHTPLWNFLQHLHEFCGEAESSELGGDRKGCDVTVPLLPSHRSLRLPHDWKTESTVRSGGHTSLTESYSFYTKTQKSADEGKYEAVM